MKRIKIMLLSLTLVAAVGGALAFKAAKRSPRLVCTTATVAGTCPATLTCNAVPPTQALTFTASAGGNRCATTVPANITNCSQTVCTIKAITATEVIP